MITALLSRRLRKWAIASVAAPVVVWSLDQVADEMDRRGRSSESSERVRKVGRTVDQVSGRRRRTTGDRPTSHRDGGSEPR